MPDLKEIKAPINEQLRIFESKFRDSMKTRVALLNTITRYIIKRKGKQMRPMFVFFSAGISGQISESSYRAASLIELLHTATLVHDDVVDDSNTRRGFFLSMHCGKTRLPCWLATICFRGGFCWLLITKSMTF